MKRFWEKIKSFFSGPEKATHIGYFVGITAWLIAAIVIISMADKTPASEADFKELESEITAIQKESTLLFKTDCEIDVADEIITVKLENEECSLKVEFDQNFEIISTEKFDPADDWIMVVGLLCILSLGLVYPLSEAISALVMIIEDVSASIKRRKKSE